MYLINADKLNWSQMSGILKIFLRRFSCSCWAAKIQCVCHPLDGPKAGEAGRSVPTTSCSLERGGAMQVCLGWRLSGCLGWSSCCLRVFLSPCLSGNVKCSGVRQVGARKRLNMARYSGFKHYCKKSSGLMIGRKGKQIKQGLIFYLPDPFVSDLLDFRKISSTFLSQPVF